MSLLRLDQFLSSAAMFPHQPILLPEAEADPKTPKKRAETWAHEETRTLVVLRLEIDCLFNTSKSNKHLWDQISAKMRDKGFDRSPTMCTDKWRNLLKEFKKAKAGTGLAKMGYYKELDELLKIRSKNAGLKGAAGANVNAGSAGSGNGIKVDAYMQFSDKGLEDVNSPFGSAEGGRSTPNVEGHLDHDRHPLAITAADADGNGVPPWNWRYNPPSGPDDQASYDGRVILVKLGEYSRKIRIDGTAEAIKEAIKSAFGLRTKRAFWLEDEDDVVCSLDRDMPLGTYTLHLDDGVTIKLCVFDGTDRIPPVRTEEKTFYTEDDFRDFLSRRGWNGLRELTGFQAADSLDDLRPDAIYQGVRLLNE